MIPVVMVGGYEVLRRLSEGAAAEVFLARSEETQRRVIIEVLHAELAREQDIVQRFLETSRLRRQLAHPNVARRVLEGTTADGRPYSITEAEGDSVATVLTTNGPFRVELLVQVAVKLCDALQFLHEKGVVHGNLKPSTVYLNPEGEELKPQVVDWGLALMRPGKTMPRVDGRQLVESEYMSPERIRGQRATAASDIYAMGILLYEMLTGFPPFTGTDSVAVRRRHLEEAPAPLPEHAAPLAPVIARCLAKSAAERYPSAAALRDALIGLVPGELEPAAVQVGLAPRAAESTAETGQVLGSYELIEPLGEGAMGRVFLAKHTKLGRKVALKLLKPEHAQNKEQLARFIQEAQAVNKINHEHIVEIYDFVEDPLPNGELRVYCVMEVLRGDTLGKVQKRGPVPLARGLAIIRQVASALDAAHRVGVVHRDIKPDNIFVTEKRGQDFVKVVDFGVAKLRGTEPVRDPTGPAPREPEATEEGATSTGVVIGTPAFMPPEQALGKPSNHRVDIYSLGVVLYRLVVGKVPFMAGSFSELVTKLTGTPAPALPELSKSGEKVPEMLRRLVAACLEKDPEKRPQSMGEVVSAIDEVLGALAGPAPEAAAAPPKKASIRLLAAGGVALALVGALAFFAFRPAPPPPPLVVVQPAPPVAVQPSLPTEVEATVESAPPGAAVVRIDTGEALGTTPFTTRLKYAPGEVAIRLELAGHEPVESKLQTDKSTAVSLMLRPLPPPPSEGKKGKTGKSGGKTDKVDRDAVLTPF